MEARPTKIACTAELEYFKTLKNAFHYHQWLPYPSHLSTKLLLNVVVAGNLPTTTGLLSYHLSSMHSPSWILLLNSSQPHSLPCSTRLILSMCYLCRWHDSLATRHHCFLTLDSRHGLKGWTQGRCCFGIRLAVYS